MHETEIKLPITDLHQANNKVRKLNASILKERHLEDNFLFDRQERFLANERMLLRLRIMASPEPPFKEWKAILTFKGVPEVSDGVKKREEIESEIMNSNNLKEILFRLGFEITFRYQKYRTVYRLENADLDICIDETPIGNFFELEGEILRIHEFATKLGYNRDDYITQSYATLYYRWCQKTGNQEPYMVF
ncbi:class IV adenylate cyclase [bacterium]|nr:class IV adenylate cyclase [bacterium]MCI0601396.1 class IV adenylate cyclase [bacterium]